MIPSQQQEQQKVNIPSTEPYFQTQQIRDQQYQNEYDDSLLTSQVPSQMPKDHPMYIQQNGLRKTKQQIDPSFEASLDENVAFAYLVRQNVTLQNSMERLRREHRDIWLKQQREMQWHQYVQTLRQRNLLQQVRVAQQLHLQNMYNNRSSSDSGIYHPTTTTSSSSSMYLTGAAYHTNDATEIHRMTSFPQYNMDEFRNISTGAHPTGVTYHPTGAHSTGAHPTGAHPTAAHPTGATYHTNDATEIHRMTPLSQYNMNEFEVLPKSLVVNQILRPRRRRKLRWNPDVGDSCEAVKSNDLDTFYLCKIVEVCCFSLPEKTTITTKN